jgi:hypothetical protein
LVKYDGRAHRYRSSIVFLMRRVLNGDTLCRQADEATVIDRRTGAVRFDDPAAVLSPATKRTDFLSASLGLIYKYSGEWQLSLQHNLLAARWRQMIRLDGGILALLPPLLGDGTWPGLHGAPRELRCQTDRPRS